MYNPASEPDFDGKLVDMPEPGQKQGPPPYSTSDMGPGQPTQQQLMQQPPMQQPPMQQPPMMQQPLMMQQPMMQQPMMQQPMMQPPGHMMQSSNTNTVIVVQQQPTQFVIQGPRPWATGLCSCCDDCGVCFLGWWCPCILQCMVSSNAGECCCVAAMCPIALRTKIRIRHNIAGSIMDDCCTLCCCGICALCQMARELNIHGI